MQSKNTKVISIMNQKGGVGKTKTADIVARDLAYKNFNVLLIDFDPQMTLTKQFGIDPLQYTNTLQDSSVVFTADKIPKPIQVPIDSENKIFLDMLFASPSLKDYSQSGMSARELKLKKFIKKIKQKNIYDYIIIDTAGTLGVLFTNAALCTDTIILPIATTKASTDSTEYFFKELVNIEEEFDHAIDNVIVFGNMFNKVTMHDKEQLNVITEDIPSYIDSQKNIGNLTNLSLHIVSEVPNRTVIKDATGNGIYLREYIKLYANNKSNKDILKTYDEIFSIITKKDFN